MSEARIHLRDSYTVDVDGIDKEQWNCVLEKFDDANLMQTWSWASVRWGNENLSHVLLRKNGELVAAAQAVIKRVPLLRAGVCRVRGGPVWQLREGNKDTEILRHMLRALRRVYVQQRGLLLQIFPATLEDGTGTVPRIFAEEGFELNPDGGDPQTALIDLSYPLDEIRGSLRRRGRRNLSHAERNDLSIRHGTGDEMFEALGKLYNEGLRRRGFASVVDVDQLKRTQRSLPEPQKTRIMLCEYHGEPVSGIAVSYLGNTALALVSGTADQGLRLYGSYLLHWRMVEWLKEHGCRWYDLHGVNPAVPSGDTQFKLGFAGRLGVLQERLGPFETSHDGTRQVFVRAGLRLRRAYIGLKGVLGSGIPALRSTIASRHSSFTRSTS